MSTCNLDEYFWMHVSRNVNNRVSSRLSEISSKHVIFLNVNCQNVNKQHGCPGTVRSRCDAVAHVATCAPPGELVHEAYYCEIGSASTILFYTMLLWRIVTVNRYSILDCILMMENGELALWFNWCILIICNIKLCTLTKYTCNKAPFRQH